MFSVIGRSLSALQNTVGWGSKEKVSFERAPVKDIPSVPSIQELKGACDYLLDLQRRDGYWWFTLEANETLGAEFILLMHYLGQVDERIQAGICQRMLDMQREDGTWTLYFEGPPNLSTTIECYWALKINGMDIDDPRMIKARQYILEHGGLEKARVFTKIHLALFGLIPWEACPAMPVEYYYLPHWLPFNKYEFSSWARATIVPLLVMMSERKVAPRPNDKDLEELFC